MNLFTKEKQTHRHKEHTYEHTYGYQRGKRVGEGQIRSLGLTYANYYIKDKQQGPTIAQGTRFNNL